MKKILPYPELITGESIKHLKDIAPAIKSLYGRGIPALLAMTILVWLHCSIPLAQAESNKIVSLAPAITQCLLELEEENRLIGVTAYSPLKNHNNAIIGDAFALNLELIIKLKPNLVLGLTELNSDKQKAQLKALGLNVVFLGPLHNWQDIETMFLKIATLTDSNQKAHIILEKYHTTLQTLQEKSNKYTKQTAFVQLSLKPLMTIGGNSFLTAMLHRLNIQTLYSDIPLNAMQVSPENVILRKPDWVIDVSFFNKANNIYDYWKPYRDVISQDHILIVKEDSLTLPTPESYVLSLKTLDLLLLKRKTR
jgi:ABC-type Fe3+-hydroxamate transport system substrate-binding protein